MTLSEYISNYLRDAQNRIAEVSNEMNTLEDQGSYKYEELSRSRLEMALFMDMLYEGKWLVRKGTLEIIAASRQSTCVVEVSDIGNLSEGDIVYIKNVRGMTQLNGSKFIARNIYENTFELFNQTTNDPINSTSFGTYTAGGNVEIGWYNHMSTTDWSDWDVISEIEHLRYYNHINEAPGINFTGHYLKIASTISGGGTGSGTSLPAGLAGQIIWYNLSNVAEATDYDIWAGQLDIETITDYFTGRT
jgi:hypothetical protein